MPRIRNSLITGHPKRPCPIENKTRKERQFYDCRSLFFNRASGIRIPARSAGNSSFAPAKDFMHRLRCFHTAAGGIAYTAKQCNSLSPAQRGDCPKPRGIINTPGNAGTDDAWADV